MKGIRLVGFALVMLLALGSSVALAGQEDAGAGSVASEAGGLSETTANSETFALPNGQLETRVYPEPINYRYVVATSLDGIMGARQSDLRVLELSTPRRVDLIKGAAWLVCLKSLRNSLRLPPAYYAVVIQREKIAESRIAVGTDGCEAQPYTPFDWNLEKTRPVQQ